MRTSVYLNKERQAAVEASGLTLLDIIDRGLASLPPEHPLAGRRTRRDSSQCPPHPKGRVTKGFCGLCGHQVGTEKIA